MDSLHPAPTPAPESPAVVLPVVDCVFCPHHPREYLDLVQPDDLDPCRLIGVCHLCARGEWFAITRDADTLLCTNHGRIRYPTAAAASAA